MTWALLFVLSCDFWNCVLLTELDMTGWAPRGYEKPGLIGTPSLLICPFLGCWEHSSHLIVQWKHAGELLCSVAAANPENYCTDEWRITLIFNKLPQWKALVLIYTVLLSLILFLHLCGLVPQSWHWSHRNHRASSIVPLSQSCIVKHWCHSMY